MFEDLFIDQGAIANYRGAPLLDERLSYLLHCTEAGSRPPTLRKIAAHQISLIHLLDLHEGDRVSVAQVEAAAGQWSLPGGRRSRRPALPQARSEIPRPRGTLAAFHGHAGRTRHAATRPRRRGRDVRGMDARRARVVRRDDPRLSQYRRSVFRRAGVRCHPGRGRDHRHRPGGRTLACSRLQPGHDPRLLAASSHLLPVRRTPGLVHTGLGRRSHAVRGSIPASPSRRAWGGRRLCVCSPRPRAADRPMCATAPS